MSEELSKFFAAIAEEKKKSKAKTKQRSKKSEDFIKQFSEEFEKLKEQEEQHKRDVAAMEAFLTQPSPPKPEPEYIEEDTAEDEGKMIYGGMWEEPEPEPDPEPELIPETPLQEQALEYLKTKKKEIAEESAEVESIKKQIQDLKKNITSLSLAQQGMGGGGAVNIRDMDDVDRSTALVNGKFLKYNSATGKFIGADATAGDSDEAAILDNSGTPELATGITAAEVRTLIGAGTSSFDGAYGSLSGRPTIPAAPALEDNSGTPALATGITAAEVRTAIGAGTSSFDGAYSSLSGKPTIPAAPALEDNSGTPALATGITAAEVRTAIGAIDDYTVTQSDVTAHQAALSITESQISDLQSYLTSVSQAAVTAHQAALSITESQISDLGSYITNSVTNTSTDAIMSFTTTEDSSSAGPVIDLKRNSSSPADSDYIGQLKFKGENDADQEVIYAKLSGKISDVTDGTEDGLIEITVKHGGSNRIVARFTGNELKLLNGSGIDVASGGTIDGELASTATATTAAGGDNSTKIATTAFVKQEIDALKALLYAYDQS